MHTLSCKSQQCMSGHQIFIFRHVSGRQRSCNLILYDKSIHTTCQLTLHLFYDQIKLFLWVYKQLDEEGAALDYFRRFSQFIRRREDKCGKISRRMDNVIMVSMIRRGKSNNVVCDGLFEMGFLYYIQGYKDVKCTLYINSKLILLYGMNKMFLNER